MKRQYRGLPLWLPSLLSRTAFYFFLMSLTLFLLYVLGNFQYFSDENLRLLLDIMELYFYSFLILSIGTITVHIVFHNTEKGRHTIRFYVRTSLRMLLIVILYFIIKLLDALFSG